MRDFRAFIRDTMDSTAEAAGYAGQMARCGLVDDELFETVRKLDTSDVDYETIDEVLSGLKLAVGIDLGLIPKKTIVPSVVDELDFLDVLICAARFLDMRERAVELEAMLVCMIVTMPEYYAQDRFQKWAHEYAELVGVKDPNQIRMLRAILSTRAMADEDLRTTEGFNPVEVDNENRKFFDSFRARNLN